MKFPNFKNLIFQITLICIVISIISGNQEASTKTISGMKKRVQLSLKFLIKKFRFQK